MTPADELKAAAALLRALTYGFDADFFYRRDVTYAAEKGILSAPAKLWAQVMSPAVAEPQAVMLEANIYFAETEAKVGRGPMFPSVQYDAALSLARAITKAAGQ
jgi:hypothetical protein